MVKRTVCHAKAGVAVFFIVAVAVTPASAQEDTDARVYREACAACHGDSGRGQPQPTVGFDLPLPDFTDCGFATREPDGDWFGVVHGGGPARAFDPMMPAFADALTTAEIEAAVSHVRTFCPDRRWPRGELNLPRALVTEKAYPEDEAVVTVVSDTEGAGGLEYEFVYEKRLGPRSQYEVKLPFSMATDGNGWIGGAGDLALGVKHALFHSLPRGAIFSLAGEIILPTGDEDDGAGTGVGVFEPFAAYGQLLPGDAFIQAQAGFEFPFDSAQAGREGFWRFVAGKTFTQGGYMRAWTPMIELVAARELESGAAVDWDLVPQMQVSLSTRQHVLLNLGLRVPLNDAPQRTTRFRVYVLWDWFDGGLLDGW